MRKNEEQAHEQGETCQYAFQTSKRCGAKNRRGKPCQCPAVKGKNRCRLHGGAAGSGAQKGNKNALKHGKYTQKAIDERRAVKIFLQKFRQTLTKAEVLIES